jgi:LytR cell envelope-related transcriptional attenuator
LPTEILQEIGSYAGLAAVVGLAVLSALYFSQARDVKRLREWAGRAPERSLEQQPGVPPATPAGRVMAQPQQQPAPPGVPVPGAPRPAAASATGLRPASATAGPGQATEEHDALASDTGDEEAVGTDTGEAAAVATGETGDHEAGVDEETGEREAVGAAAWDTGDDAAASDNGDGEATGAGDALGDEDADEERDEDEALEGDEDLDEERDEDERFAPPEGEPAVAAGRNTDEEERDEAGEREPVGAQARTQQRAVAQSGLAAPPATPAGGMASGSQASQRPATPAGGTTSGSQASPRPAPAGLPPRPVPGRPGSPPTSVPRPRGMPPGGALPSQTAILPQPSRAPWYRTPRYLVLVIAGILIVGGGAAFGVVQLTKDDSTTTATPAGNDAAAQDQAPSAEGGSGGGGGGGKAKAPVDPKKVTVAVLNGTTVEGLAAQIGDKLGNFGFQLGNITNSTDQDQGRAESAVLYAPGHQREALAVSRKLRIDQREQIDAETQSVAGDATVVVIVGIDQTR